MVIRVTPREGSHPLNVPASEVQEESFITSLLFLRPLRQFSAFSAVRNCPPLGSIAVDLSSRVSEITA